MRRADDHSGRRPFYTEYAWAFDLLIDRPVRKECATIAQWLVERSVRPGAGLIDAGCGTGRYAIELARRGYAVTGVDASPELLAQARESARGLAPLALSVSFVVGDILRLPRESCDAILCRGVLNDFPDDHDRDAVFRVFAHALRPAGVLVLDVRDWDASVERKSREPLFRKRVETERGLLTFTSVTTLDVERRTLRIAETHTLVTDGLARTSEYAFEMRCWTRDELAAALAASSFADVAYFGAYDPMIRTGQTDRIVAVAHL